LADLAMLIVHRVSEGGCLTRPTLAYSVDSVNTENTGVPGE
jgi:hypothetical protein